MSLHTPITQKSKKRLGNCRNRQLSTKSNIFYSKNTEKFKKRQKSAAKIEVSI